MIASTWWCAALALALQASAPVRDATASVAAPRLELRVEPFVDQWFWVRWLSQRESLQPSTDVPNVADAFHAVREAERSLGSPLAFGVIEGMLGRCASAKDALEAFATAPETWTAPGGHQVELRKLATKIGEGMRALEATFLERVWPAHRDRIVDARERLAAELEPREAECMAYLARHLAFDRTPAVIPVYLVLDAPSPGAVTHRDDAGRGVCFVSVAGHAGSQLVETILHEATHALDVGADRSVLADLRSRLERAGITRRDREWRDVPHTLMFVHAGETVRRAIDPAHKHYGEVAGYYAKLRGIAEIELELWPRYLDGKLERDAALDAIVERVLALRAK